MKNYSQIIYPDLQRKIDKILLVKISDSRRAILQPLIDYIQQKIKIGLEVNLNFICTQNSRRSQFSQLWAQTASDYYGIPINCYSGGVEVNAFNKRAVASVERSGFKVTQEGMKNPRFQISVGDKGEPIIMYSKLYDDKTNPSSNFAAVMTCSHADENCPLVAGAESRIRVLYDDPKEFDDTPQEPKMYDERSFQIASELFYVFYKIDMS